MPSWLPRPALGMTQEARSPNPCSRDFFGHFDKIRFGANSNQLIDHLSVAKAEDSGDRTNPEIAGDVLRVVYVDFDDFDFDRDASFASTL